MFSIVLPKNRHLFQDSLELMFANRGREAFGQDTIHSIYILYEDKKRGLFGSCRVNPFDESIFTKTGLVDEDNALAARLLEVSLVSFDVEKKLTGDPNKVFLTKWFYVGLLETLKTLAITQSAKGYISFNTPKEHHMCEVFGDFFFECALEWPPLDDQPLLHSGFLKCAVATNGSTAPTRSGTNRFRFCHSAPLSAP